MDWPLRFSAENLVVGKPTLTVAPTGFPYHQPHVSQQLLCSSRVGLCDDGCIGGENQHPRQDRCNLTLLWKLVMWASHRGILLQSSDVIGSSSFSSTNWSDLILDTSLAGMGGKLEANENRATEESVGNTAVLAMGPG